MALRLQVSNSLTQLANSFCKDLKNYPRGIFQPDYIITQTEGMNSWLRLRLADQLGIAANYQFLKPNDLIHQAYRVLGGQYVKPLSSEGQCWLLFKILSEKEFKSRFRYVAEYYLTAGAEAELKRMTLAEKVADLFDQYQIYRPEMIMRWNQQDPDGLTADEWQAYLWIRARELSGEKMPDKTSVGQYILEALKDPLKQEKLREQLPAAWLFGLSVTTNFHIQIFSEIGRFIDISFYLLNPAPSVYWFDDRSEKQLALMKKKGWAAMDETSLGNTLLTSWGRVIQSTFSMLFENEELLNAYQETGLDEPLGDCLLRKVQEDIFHSRPDGERSNLTEDDLRDGSLSVNSCYTPFREVEALYNYLVHLVDKRKLSLSARDIVVMVSDVNAYAPYIRAVFDNAPYRFPYSIADESLTADDTVAAALKSILALNENDFKAEAVLQLLDSTFIRERFGISDLGLIRKVVARAGVRFGIEGTVEDETCYVSWKYGLKRIIYGLCMSGEAEYTQGKESFFPLDMVEGNSSQQVIRFCHFVTVLIKFLEERKQRRRIAEWGRYVEAVLSNFVIDGGHDSSEDLNLLLKQIETYNSLNALLEDELSYDVFCHGFLRSIGSVARSGSFAGGGVTFCSLIPMRSIPFKVVCLLGLNFDKFPRREQQSGFNLMEREKRKGDRNVKENDKHLFLETLLSAREFLYLSYIGQSSRDNSSIPPSALVDELLDFIESAYVGEEDLRRLLVKNHPLHSFGKQKRNASGALPNYLEDSVISGSLTDLIIREPEQLQLSEVSVERFISFFKHPVKAHYNHVLNIRYESEDVLLSETELFEMDNLQKWGLKQELLFSGQEEREILRNRLVKTGGLPLKNMADVTLSDVEEIVSPLRTLLHQLIGTSEEASVQVELDFQEERFIISGSLGNIYGSKMVFICWSKNEAKYLMEAYIRYLIARSAGLDLSLHFISAQKERRFDAAGLDQSVAKMRLRELIEIFRKGHQVIIPFWPDFKVNPKQVADLNHEDLQKLVKDKIENFEYPCNDPYILNKYKEGYYEEDASYEMFMDCANLLIEPLTMLFPEYYE